MPRLRLGVVLLVPPPLGREVDGLRRACGDRALGRVAPHLTLVPPVNVREDAVPAALQVLRAAAASTPPIDLTLGPPATFEPDSPTVYLAVTGSDRCVAALDRLRDLALRPPLERAIDWPFVPHVTIADEMAADRIGPAVRALGDYRVDAHFSRLHLLHEQQGDDGGRRWVPIADYPLGPRRVVGRGGLPVELTITELVDPEAADFEAREWALERRDRPTAEPTPVSARPVVVTARRELEGVVGVLRGWADGDRRAVASVLVAASARGQGVVGHLRAAFEDASH